MNPFQHSRLFAICLALIIAAQSTEAFAQRRRPQSNPILERNIRAELGFLASDAMQGRGSMTGYERIAAEYIGSQFRQFGLIAAGDEIAPGTRGFVQRVPLQIPKFRQPPTLSATAAGETHKWTFGRDFLIPFTKALSASGELRVIEPNGALVKGAAVLIKSTVPLDPQKRQDLARRAHDAQVAILIFAESDANKSMREGGTTRLPNLPAQIKGEQADPSFVLVSLRQEALMELAAMPSGTHVEFGGETENEEGSTWNAVGVLPGSDPQARNDAIMLSAHLDHLGTGTPVNGDSIFNGADDDASGCVAVMELARALAAGPRLKRTVYFVCFGSEEKGGYGAKYFVDHSPVPLTRIVADVTFEMLGRPDPKIKPGTLWLTGYDRSNLGPELAKQGARLVADPHPEQNFFQRSDNYTLALRGVVAHTVSSFGLHSDYHRPSDELSKIDFRFMTQSISSLVAPIRWLASSSFRPAWLPGRAPGGEST